MVKRLLLIFFAAVLSASAQSSSMSTFRIKSDCLGGREKSDRDLAYQMLPGGDKAGLAGLVAEGRVHVLHKGERILASCIRF